MAETDDGLIVGMDGLTTRPTPSALSRRRRTMDLVRLRHRGIAAALGADAVGSTECGACGRPLEVVIREGEPENATVGWLPDESCSNVMAEFCPSALLFCSRAHLEEWRAAREGTGSGEVLDASALAERGRSFRAELVP
jgi:hypothetical protein